MIEPGGKWAMESNDHDMQHRTAICIQSNGQVVVVIVDRLGFSLFELASILQTSNPAHIFNCDSDIALDGGLSAQAYFQPQKIEISGGWNIHDALIVKRRDAEPASVHR
jgi:exopolysaccharide biosynthesis protein